ncbi:phage tail protein [Thermoleptolyngbya sp. M55_K2018_002]|uniref:phage tail protein n=1 Tax=Thermoleptolyngbya sp. M55_K2018_002 TaxID=2747808 RepID=UPI001A08E7C0|nr:phage tail protein [Thermoleptolyngbya sp. M55_K2018_002]HIK42153.1 phage tail protein [Thermoleptolyngbya sp. M55_K2018_002]
MALAPPPLNKPRRRIWGVLGSVEFELEVAPNSFGLKESTEYASHDRIEGKPRLQWTGDALHEADMTFRWLYEWCDPEQQIKLLRDEMAKHEPLRLVIGSRYVGAFVILDITSSLIVTDEVGRTLQLEATVKLKEAPLPKNFGARRAKNFALVSPFRRR